MKKRLLSLLLACAMVCSLMPAAFAASGSFENFRQDRTYSASQFRDVKPTAWYYDSVKTAYELGLVNGSGPSSYNPTGKITVAETVALACRIHSIYMGDSYEFTQGSPWYQCYIDYADQNGITYSPTTNFSTPATRTEFAYILSSSIPSYGFTKKNHVVELPDVDFDNYAYNQILMLYRAGVLSGSDKYGSFHPTSSITRQEMAAIVSRIAMPDTRKAFTLENIPNITVKPVGCSKDIQFEITQQSFQPFSTEYYHYYFAVVGIKNTGRTPIYTKNCTFDVEDKSGHLLQSDSYISSTRDVIAPGKTAYFYRKGSFENGLVPSDNMRLTAQITLKKSNAIPEEYAVSDTAIHVGSYGDFTITGRVTNHIDKDVSSLYLNAVLYDSNNQVIDVLGTSVSKLYAGATASFEMNGYTHKELFKFSRIDHYEIIAQDFYYQYD